MGGGILAKWNLKMKAPVIADALSIQKGTHQPIEKVNEAQKHVKGKIVAIGLLLQTMWTL